MVPTGVRIHHVVRIKTPCSLIDSDDTLMVAVCIGSRRCERSGVKQLRGAN